jgi:hypothetical protein
MNFYFFLLILLTKCKFSQGFLFLLGIFFVQKQTSKTRLAKKKIAFLKKTLQSLSQKK